MGDFCLSVYYFSSCLFFVYLFVLVFVQGDGFFFSLRRQEDREHQVEWVSEGDLGRSWRKIVLKIDCMKKFLGPGETVQWLRTFSIFARTRV